jgi:hypothetical protein
MRHPISQAEKRLEEAILALGREDTLECRDLLLRCRWLLRAAREEEDGPEAAERRAEEVYADQMSRAAQWLEREGLL